jgi:pimeloyl-ACP methyl ester carboxylesterase
MTTWPAAIELDGARIHTDVRGSGEPVLLLHGLACDQRLWDDQWAPLSERYCAIRIDLHGFGKSSPISGPYSHTAILGALIERLGVGPSHIVGHSMGGRIAAELVQSHPHVARSLTLISADIAGLPFKTLGSEFAKIFEAGRHDVAAAKRLFLELQAFRSLRERPAAFARMQRMVSEYSGWLFANVRDNPERRPSPATAEMLGEFRLPALVMAGELDSIDFREIAGEVARRIPAAKTHVFEHAGHVPNLEQPDDFNARILDFLDSVKA